MKNRNSFKLDLLARISDAIIERVTAQRYLLTQKMEKNRKRVILMHRVRIASAVAALLLLCIGIGFLLQLLPKQAPIYTGMSIRSAEQIATVDHQVRESVSYLAAPVGHVSGDHSGRDHTLDKTHPFGKDAPSVEDAAKSSLKVLGTAKDIYYAKPNEDIYITVHFENPDDFEILSFTLNGEKYTSYMFEDGSDMENIILKKNVGTAEGILEYTIDAIKYVDGTEIKDVRIEGDTTVRAGVFTEKQPTANVTEETVDFGEISFDVHLTDLLHLITLSGGKAYAVLYDGERILDTKNLAIEKTESVRFEGLSDDTLYQYAIVAVYDALDGNGTTLHLLESKAFYTKAAVLFDGVILSQTGVSFGYQWDEAFHSKRITSLTLSQDGNILRELNADATEVTGLLSNNEYTLTATYKNGKYTEQIDITFTTLAKTAPTVKIVNPNKTQESIRFDLSVTDPDSIGTMTKIELLHGNDEPIVAENTDVRTFDGLLSNNTYTVKLTYSYDLNDGNGIHVETVTLDIKTEAKTAPTVKIVNLNKTQASIGFDLSVTDPEDLCTVTKVELLRGTDSTDLEIRASYWIEDLLSNNVYTVRVTYTYDLNDGNGLQTKKVTQALRTDTKAMPSLSVAVTGTSATSISFETESSDRDDVIKAIEIKLLNANGETVALNPTGNTFSSLASSQAYQLVVSCSYDLNDGNGIRIMTHRASAATAENVTLSSVYTSVQTGEVILLQFKYTPIPNVTPHSVTINGQSASLTDSGLHGNYYATFLPDLNSGVFRVESVELTATVNGALHTFPVEFTSFVEVSVFGEISIASITLSNGKNHVEKGESALAYVDFTGSEPYTVKSIQLSISPPDYPSEYADLSYSLPLTKISDTRYSFEPIYNEGLRVKSVTYVLSGSEITLNLPSVDAFFYEYRNAEAIPISSPEQLQSMERYGSYILTCDLDMSGFDWKPFAFSGFLNGNGFVIKNLTVTAGTQIALDELGIGMFSHLDGVLVDVTLTNAKISFLGSVPRVYYLGLLAGQGNGAILVNCHAVGDVSCSVNSDLYHLYLAGLVGQSSLSIYDSCSFKGTLTALYNYSTSVSPDLSGISNTMHTYHSFMRDCRAESSKIVIKDGVTTVT